jgi:hypothetical protein
MADWLVLHRTSSDGAHIAYHRFSTPRPPEKGFYRQSVSSSAFFFGTHGRIGRAFKAGHFFSDDFGDARVAIRVLPELPAFTHEDLWAFYKFIGYDHKIRREVKSAQGRALTVPPARYVITEDTYHPDGNPSHCVHQVFHLVTVPDPVDDYWGYVELGCFYRDSRPGKGRRFKADRTFQLHHPNYEPHIGVAEKQRCVRHANVWEFFQSIGYDYTKQGVGP